MLTYIQEALAGQGHKAAMTGIDILEKLQEDLRNLQNKEKLNDYQNRLIEERYDWELPKVDFEIKSILLVGKKNTITKLKFEYKGKEIPVIMPPGYNEYFNAPDRIEHFMQQLLGEKGYKCKATPMLPNKLLAARSGFAKYGRNNIVYIDGMGSFCQVYLFYTDIPVEEHPFSKELIMKRCATCGACIKVCPTGAIMKDRFLLDSKRCLTFLNENGGYPFPAWVDPKIHHALYGCNRCQEICPANREQLMNPVEEVLFSEEETKILLEGESIDTFPDRLKNEIKRLNIEEYLSVVPRNLNAIFDQS
ncbi:4Fe-4S double cluster binding domain-containing protein [Sedimentibacter saalensis]|uniref:Epoxyqueuosine reductase n=1 Tax=Sedimentibacter saalensis TaxID=130788 RepID=A0A562J3M0_9FIRM|nr:4Fe-4S double cluster binding domain-containing protein [Sedimentibacter saalensis]TWH77742.1 epoxyqueuosine reductase [Sedimentibacter saalensis]